MADGATVELVGLADALKAMEKLGTAVEKRIIRKGLRGGCKVIQSAAVAEAPERSGLTKEHIKVRAGRSRKGAISLNVSLRDRDYAGVTFYAAFVLFGHRVGSRKLGDKRTLVPANDFMGRAAESSAERAVQTTVVIWKDEIEQAASKK